MAIAKRTNLNWGGVNQGQKKKNPKVSQGNFFYIHSRDAIHVKKHNGNCGLLWTFSVQSILCGLCVEMPCT